MENPNYRITLEMMADLPYLIRQKDLADFLGISTRTVNRRYPELSFPCPKPVVAKAVCKDGR